jgi:hypothetical protein
VRAKRTVPTGAPTALEPSPAEDAAATDLQFETRRVSERAHTGKRRSLDDFEIRTPIKRKPVECSRAIVGAVCGKRRIRLRHRNDFLPEP